MRQPRPRFRNAALAMAALMSVLALPVCATEPVTTPQPIPTHRGSFGVGVNGAGMAFEGHWMRASGWGLFLGYSNEGKGDSDNTLPLGQAVVSQNKSSFHFGLAWRHTAELTFGLGAGVLQTEWVLERSGWVTPAQSAQLDAPPERKWGPHGFIEIGEKKGFALQIQAGPAGLGISVHVHF